MASLVRIHPMQHMTENRQKNNVQRGPFRFTQLWNDIIHHMKGHVEVKKRRHLVKNYDNCFIGTEAVDVLMNYLLTVSNILKCDITRDKAIKLAQALMDNNVFESVSSSSAQTAKKISFEDSASHLYRFCEDSTEASTQKVEKTPNTKRRSRRSSFGLPSKQKFVVKDVPKTPDTERVISNPLPFSPYGELFHRILQDSTCNDSQGNMSTASSTSIVQSRDIDDVWREVALERLLHVIDVPMLDHVLKCITDNKQEDSHNIVISNVFANTHSPAQTSTPSDGWIVSALDCLDQHPESLRIIESLIGSDGNISDASDIQEMDTLKKKALFKVVQDLYHGQREPLLPKGFFELYTAILTLLSNGKCKEALFAVQLHMILLNRSTRDSLKRLLNFMSHAATSHGVRLDQDVDNRTLVRRSFTNVIIHHPMLSKGQSEQLVIFMMDQNNEVFEIPDRIAEEVEEKLSAARHGKDYLPNNETYCTMISKIDYEKEKVNLTRDALRDLMNYIIDDVNLSLKQKKQKLKQLQKAHSDVYDVHFHGFL